MLRLESSGTIPEDDIHRSIPFRMETMMADSTTIRSAESRREALTWLARRLAWERRFADLRREPAARAA